MGLSIIGSNKGKKKEAAPVSLWEDTYPGHLEDAIEDSSPNSLYVYFLDDLINLASFKRLSEKENIILLKTVNDKTTSPGEKETLIKTIVQGNVHLLLYQAKSFVGHGLPFMDLVQEGVFGLVKAIKNYDPETKTKDGKDTSFNLFATSYIRGQLHRTISKSGYILRIPDNLAADMRRFEEGDDIKNPNRALIQKAYCISLSCSLDDPIFTEKNKVFSVRDIIEPSHTPLEIAIANDPQDIFQGLAKNIELHFDKERRLARPIKRKRKVVVSGKDVALFYYYFVKEMSLEAAGKALFADKVSFLGPKRTRSYFQIPMSKASAEFTIGRACIRWRNHLLKTQPELQKKFGLPTPKTMGWRAARRQIQRGSV